MIFRFYIDFEAEDINDARKQLEKYADENPFATFADLDDMIVEEQK